MTVVEEAPARVAADVFAAWLEEFGAALESGEPARTAAAVLADGYWRDILAFGWDYRTSSGRAEIEAAFRQTLPHVRPRDLRPAAGRTAPRLVKRAAKWVVEAYFDFETVAGHGTGFVRLLLDDADPLQSRAWLLLTTLPVRNKAQVTEVVEAYSQRFSTRGVLPHLEERLWH